VDSQCGSSQQATGLAYALVASGVVDTALACGVELMSRVPMGSTTPKDPDVGKPVNKNYWKSHEFTSQFEGAERIAEKWGVTRADADRFGKLSQDRAAAALGLTPIATVVDVTLVGCDPVLMLEGPIPATRKLLADNGLTMDDIDVVEINEAFAAVVLAWEQELKADLERVNPNGGAIALGHPLGATGAALITKAVHELVRTEGEHAIVTMCCGGGLGTGTLLRRT
jgi:acetyl-CoA acetyltransferase